MEGLTITNKNNVSYNKPYILIGLLIASGLVIVALILLAKVFIKADHRETFMKGLNQSAQASTRENTTLEMLNRFLITPKGLVVEKIEKGLRSNFVLLESMGQLMEYAVLDQNRELFEATWSATQKELISPDGYFYWRVDAQGGPPDHATALIDDMRIVKSLYWATNAFGKPEYKQDAAKLTGIIGKYNVKNNLLIDCYNGDKGVRGNRVSLFYIDPVALKIMTELEPSLTKAAQNTLRVLWEAPTDQYGFFPTWYDVQARRYQYSTQVNMVEALYTAHMYKEAGGDITTFLNFLNNQLTQKGSIYIRYHRNGQGASRDESASVYALACRLFYEAGNKEMAQRCYDKMLVFKVSPEGHLLYGGFGDAASVTVYAFDQFEALLALKSAGEMEDGEK